MDVPSVVVMPSVKVVIGLNIVVVVNMLLLVQRQSIVVAGQVAGVTKGPEQLVFTARAATGLTMYSMTARQL
jgi:hypothetical protein